MNEVDFLSVFRADKTMLDCYANFVSNKIVSNVTSVLNVEPSIFFKIPVSFRVKGEDSLIQKAFYRNKNYKDPYRDITDKVGGRLVVLLEDQANEVCQIVENLEGFTFSKDRDFDVERFKDPELFTYKSHHYILKNKVDLILDEKVPEGTPIEIQVRTLLQHAYSELTHDAIYKPNTIASPEIRRYVARSMALIEVTDQIFSQVHSSLKQTDNQFKRIIDDTIKLFPSETLHLDRNLCTFLLDAYLTEVQTYDFFSLKKFVSEYSYIIDIIKKRGQTQLLFQQPVILLVYMIVQAKRKIAKSKWPLGLDDLEDIFTDLGISFDRA